MRGPATATLGGLAIGTAISLGVCAVIVAWDWFKRRG